MYPLKLEKMITEKQIENRIQELGKQISKDFAGESVTAICVLKGSFMFFSDLVRAIDSNVYCEFFGVSSYHGETKSSGEVKVTLDVNYGLAGQNVLLIEDIVDTGLTMSFLMKNILNRKPKVLKTATLLYKPAAMKTDCKLDYVGFEIENQFVVGYGLDYQGYYRNLPYIAHSHDFN